MSGATAGRPQAGAETRGVGGEATLPPEVEYGVRVTRLRSALDYAITARDLLDLLIEDVAKAGLELSVVREERRLGMLARAADRWLRLLDEVEGYVRGARELLGAVGARGDDGETRWGRGGG